MVWGGQIECGGLQGSTLGGVGIHGCDVYTSDVFSKMSAGLRSQRYMKEQVGGLCQPVHMDFCEPRTVNEITYLPLNSATPHVNFFFFLGWVAGGNFLSWWEK